MSKPGNPRRRFVRFYADASTEQSIEDLHGKISGKERAGGTIERLVKAAIEMVNDPRNPPAIPADVILMRQELGIATKYEPGEEAVTSQTSILEVMSETLRQLKQHSETQSRMLDVMSKKKHGK